jgi:hypothetical protein
MAGKQFSDKAAVRFGDALSQLRAGKPLTFALVLRRHDDVELVADRGLHPTSIAAIRRRAKSSREPGSWSSGVIDEG